jgi:hypothetical protein
MKQEIELNGEEYVLKSAIQTKRTNISKNKYVICRTYSAGVFAGYLKSRKGKEVILNDARRIWKWDGAATLSQLAMEGSKKPNGCKIPCAVDEVLLTECIEILSCTNIAKKNIEAIPIWSE